MTKTGTITVSNSATGATAGPLTLTAPPTIAKTSNASGGNGTFSITGGTCGNGTVITPAGGPTPTCTIIVQYTGETNTTTADGAVTITDTGALTATQTSAAFPAN
jgi:hypothetical protein